MLSEGYRCGGVPVTFRLNYTDETRRSLGENLGLSLHPLPFVHKSRLGHVSRLKPIPDSDKLSLDI